eukprot:s579_g27.t1
MFVTQDFVQVERNEVPPFFSVFLQNFYTLSQQLSGSGMVCAWRCGSAKINRWCFHQRISHVSVHDASRPFAQKSCTGLPASSSFLNH